MTCPSCGRENDVDARFCAACGTNLVAEELEARKIVTVLFADVAGSTALGERLDPELLRRVMWRYFETVERVLERHVRDTPGPATPRQVIDDWASTFANKAGLAEIIAAEAPGAFSADELQRVSDWARARYDEILAWLSGDESVQAELDDEDEALLLYGWQLRIGALPARG